MDDNPLPDFFHALAEAAEASTAVDHFDLRSEDEANVAEWNGLLARQREAVAELLLLSDGNTAAILAALAPSP